MAQTGHKPDDMTAFRQGVEAGYTLAVEELRAAVERGAVHKKCKQAVDVLETWAVEAADRWMEDGGEAFSVDKS